MALKTVWNCIGNVCVKAVESFGMERKGEELKIYKHVSEV